MGYASLWPGFGTGGALKRDLSNVAPHPDTAKHVLYLRGDGTFGTPAGGGDLLASQNLADLGSVATARTNLGLGTASSPLFAAVFAGSSATPRSSDPGISCNRTLTGAGNAHGFSDQSEFARNAGTAYAAFDSRILVSGAVNFDHFVSLQAAPTLSTSGTTTYLYGTYVLPGITAGIVTNNYAHYVANPSLSGGAITNNWGLYIAAQTAGTNNYAAALMGKVGIGKAAPDHLLDIAGASPRIQLFDTGSSYAMLKGGNTTGNFYLGKESASGGAILTGSTAGAVVLLGDAGVPLHFGTNGALRMTIAATSGDITTTGSLTTAAPSGGTAAAWKLGVVASVSPTSPNRTIELDVGGTRFFLHAKTTND